MSLVVVKGWLERIEGQLGSKVVPEITYIAVMCAYCLLDCLFLGTFVKLEVPFWCLDWPNRNNIQ